MDLNGIKKDVDNFINKSLEEKGYEELFLLIKDLEKSIDYGSSGFINYNLLLKDNGDIFLENIFVGNVNNICGYNENELRFEDYIVRIDIDKTYDLSTNIQEAWISNISKKQIK